MRKLAAALLLGALLGAATAWWLLRLNLSANIWRQPGFTERVEKGKASLDAGHRVPFDAPYKLEPDPRLTQLEYRDIGEEPATSNVAEYRVGRVRSLPN